MSPVNINLQLLARCIKTEKIFLPPVLRARSLFHAPPHSFVPLTVCRILYDYQMSVWKLPRNEKEGDRITRWQFDAVRSFAWTFTCHRLFVVVLPDAQKLC